MISISEKIILIDDEKYEKKLLKMALKKLGIEIELDYFQNAETAYEYLIHTEDKIFLIISDVNMAGMSGIQLKKLIDKNDFLKKRTIPFIFASNSATKQEVQAAYDNNLQGYFQKPLELEDQAKQLNIIIKYWLISEQPNKKEGGIFSLKDL